MLDDRTPAAGEPAAAEAAQPGRVPDSVRAPGSRPLITAVTIENFKGIGCRPVRIDLRSLTLLFGRNSAGKSTILQALCYAHEILSHQRIDVHTVQLGGDQVDLGGFRNLVHAHDLDRSVRVRFDLNLEDSRVPQPLVQEMLRQEAEEDVDAAFPAWFESRTRPGLARSGWVAFAMRWNQDWSSRAAMECYEVGVNGSLVGRLRADDSDVHLEFYWRHPLFDNLPRVKAEPGSKAWELLAAHVQTGGSRGVDPDSVQVEPPFRRLAMPRATSPLPEWDQLLQVDSDEAEDAFLPDPRKQGSIVEIGNVGSDSYAAFRALLSGAMVGIGSLLRDELAHLRYVGPVRRLRPPAGVETGSAGSGSWSDGSAAWHLLAHVEPSPNPHARTLIDDVNDWLSRHDRLDTGYRIRLRSSVELPANASPVAMIRLLERFPALRNKAGDLDLDGWVRQEASRMAELTNRDPDAVEASIKSATDDDAEAQSARSNTSDEDETDHELIETSQSLYRILVSCVAYVDSLEKGNYLSAIRDLVRSIATSPLHKTLQLVAAGSELPVRTSDIGVGISQLLPVVVAALDPDRPGITAIEQPELHAHPKLQVELGDLFAHAADDHRVFLLENHSEHLMLRLLRRIEETHNGELPEGKPALRPDQVSVVYLDQVDGEVQATRLRIDETGEFIDRWPHGFFEERADELF